MRILYIPSGFFDIYQFFDKCILRECNNLGHICKSFSLYKGLDDLKSTVESFKPNLVFTMTGFILPTEMTEWLQSENIKLAVWMTEDPYYMDVSRSLVSRYDYVFTIDSAALKFYRESGHPNIFFLPLGTHPGTFSRKHNISEEELRNDLCLVGYPYPERIDIINLLLKETSYKIQVVGGKWKDKLKNWSTNRLLKISDWLPPYEVANHYHHSKIILNIHRPYNLKENKNSIGIINRSINNRTFDIAASGVFQLLSHKPDLCDFFTEEEIVSFRSKKELLYKIDYYIKHKKERNEIALRAQSKVLSQHTFSHRIEEIISIVEKSQN